MNERWRVLECPSRAPAHAYPGVIITTCTSHLGTVERVTRLLSKSTTEFPGRQGAGKKGEARDNPPIQTASGEGGTTGKDRLAKTPQARSVVGLRRGSREGEEREPGR